MENSITSGIFMNENLRDNEDSCIICYNTISEKDICETDCNHIYCSDCINTWFDRGNIFCPMCRQNIRRYIKDNEIIRVIKINNNQLNNNQLNNNIEGDTDNENTGDYLLIQRSNIKYVQLYFFVNIIYVIYTQYYQYQMKEELENLYLNCSF